VGVGAGVGNQVLRVLVTGPDISGLRGSGVQQHVVQVLEAFSNDPAVAVTDFASASGAYLEPWIRKGTRLLGKYFAFPAAALRSNVIHINSTIDDRSMFRDSGFICLSALFGRGVVLQFHGGGAHRLRYAKSGPGHWFVRAALRRADIVLFLSAEQANPIADLYDLKRVQLVTNYVACPSIPDTTPIAHGLRVLFLGRLNVSKGAFETVRGFRAAGLRDGVLRVAGSGPDETRVRQEIAETDSAEFVGFVAGEQKSDLLRWADVLVLASAHDEGIPYSVLEAEAAGTAVISSNSGGLPQIVRDGWNGIIVPARDSDAIAVALRRLSEDEALLHSMQSHGQELVANEHSLSTMNDVFGLIYHKAARDTKREAHRG